MLFIEVLPNFVISSFFLLFSSQHFGNDPSRYRLRGQSFETFIFFGTEAEVVRARPDFWKEVNSGLIKGGH